MLGSSNAAGPAPLVFFSWSLFPSLPFPFSLSHSLCRSVSVLLHPPPRIHIHRHRSRSATGSPSFFQFSPGNNPPPLPTCPRYCLLSGTECRFHPSYSFLPCTQLCALSTPPHCPVSPSFSPPCTNLHPSNATRLSVVPTLFSTVRQRDFHANVQEPFDYYLLLAVED